MDNVSGHTATEVPYIGDAVESALAAALAGAAAAGRYDVVATLAAELQARRLARADVPSLDAARRAREAR